MRVRGSAILIAQMTLAHFVVMSWPLCVGVFRRERCRPMRRMSFMNDARSSSGMEEGSAVAADQLPAAADPQALSHRDKRLIAISMILPVFLGSVDQSVLASALPTIGRDLGQVHNLPWLITAFLIASTALTPLYGKFADIHGRRAAMLIGISVYMLGSLISAAAPNMLALIGGRIVQGCGAGGLVVTA